MTFNIIYFMHAAYTIFLFSLLVKDVLWLRVIMSAATVFVLTYAWQVPNMTIFSWNALFLLINLYHIGRLIQERRPIALPAELEAIYRDCFANMSKRDFLNFWRFGHAESLQGATVCNEGLQPDQLFYVLDGKAEVFQNGVPVVVRERMNFIAELSFFTGSPASAEVRIHGRVMAWTRDKLDDLKKINPELVRSLRESIGRSICNKLVGATA